VLGLAGAEIRAAGADVEFGQFERGLVEELTAE
jgi:hypothetical protein